MRDMFYQRPAGKVSVHSIKPGIDVQKNLDMQILCLRQTWLYKALTKYRVCFHKEVQNPNLYICSNEAHE